MLRFSASVLLFTVAVIWPSVNANFGMGKRDTNGETGYKQSIFVTYGLRLIAKMSDDPKNPTLEKKFDEAFNMKWNSEEEFFSYLDQLYKNATGKDLKEIISPFFKDESPVPRPTVGFFRMIVKREVDEETGGYKPYFLTQMAFKTIARMSDDPENPTLEKKFDEAFEKNWNNPEDLFNHLRGVYNNATGRDLKDIADFHFSDE